MEPLKIAICDDEETALAIIESAVRSTLAREGAPAELTSCVSISELRRWMEVTVFDLLMLDIDMPQTSGIAFGQELREQNSRTEIIYISSREDKVFDSLKVRPLGFVRKNHFLEDLPDAIGLFLSQRAERTLPDRLVLEQRDTVRLVELKDILYLEGARNCQMLHIAGEREPIALRRPMSEMEDEWAPKGFIRIHKGYLVNCEHIQLIQEGQVRLSNGEVLPLSRRKVLEAKQRFLIYMRTHGALG